MVPNRATHQRSFLFEKITQTDERVIIGKINSLFFKKTRKKKKKKKETR